MVHLLLDFVESERDSIWQTHIERFCSMLPCYRSFDHNRYDVIVIDDRYRNRYDVQESIKCFKRLVEERLSFLKERLCMRTKHYHLISKSS